MGAFETRLAAGYRGTCPTCMGLACEDCCHTGAGTTVVDQQQKLDTPERDVSQVCDRGGAMTPTERATQALAEALDKVDTVRYRDSMPVNEEAAAILRALPPGWRLCGPDDVTVTVERLARAAQFLLDHGDCSDVSFQRSEDGDAFYCIEHDAAQDIDLRALAALSADTTPSPSADRPPCPCRVDAQLAESSVCPACGHRDHGKSGCRP